MGWTYGKETNMAKKQQMPQDPLNFFFVIQKRLTLYQHLHVVLTHQAQNQRQYLGQQQICEFYWWAYERIISITDNMHKCNNDNNRNNKEKKQKIEIMDISSIMQIIYE